MITQKALIDTNVILRLLLSDVKEQAIVSENIFRKINKGEIKGILSILIINEAINVLTNFYKTPKENVINSILEIISIKNIGILEIDKKELIQILNNTLKLGIDFADSYLLWTGKKADLNIFSFDKKLLKNL